MSFHYPPPVSGTIPASLLVPTWQPNPTRAATRPRIMSTIDARQIPIGTFGSPSHSKVPRPMWAIELEQAAKRVRDLRPGWDGPGSSVVAESVIQRAVALARVAMTGMSNPSVPYLMPAGDGSLQIEWDSVHAKLEFCLEPDGSLDFWSRDLRTGAELAGEGAEAMALFLHWGPWAAGTPDARYEVGPKDPGFFAIAA